MDNNEYILPKALHDEIFKEKIEKDYLEFSKAQKSPIAIITGGQPGSGKSGITEAAATELSDRGGCIIVDADVLRKEHPSYGKLLRNNDKQAANLTHQDASQWAVELIKSAAQNRRNIIVDQTSKDPKSFDELARGLKQAGYIVEFRAMSVSEKVSQQRIYNRYETQKMAYGHGRFATKDNHDVAYKGLADVVGLAESQKLVDKITLYNKDHKEIYSNQTVDNDWSKTPQAANKINEERTRSMTPSEISELQEGYRKIKSMVEAPERNASAEEIKNINNLLAESREQEESLKQNKTEVKNGFTSGNENPDDKPLDPEEALKKLKSAHLDHKPITQQVLDSMSYRANDDDSVTYLVDKEPVFIDHGDHLSIVKGKSEDDKAIVAAVLFAKEKYHGSFELTGSEEFKKRAIELIVNHNIEVNLKSPAQDAYKKELLKNKEAELSTAEVKVAESQPKEQDGAIGRKNFEEILDQKFVISHKSAENETKYLKNDAGWSYSIEDARHFKTRDDAEKVASTYSDLTGGPQYTIEPTMVKGPSEKEENFNTQASSQKSINQKPDSNGVRLVGFGHAKYQFQDNEGDSFYVQTQGFSGDIKTVWGVDLERAIYESGVKVGDNIELQNLGRQAVTVEKPIYDAYGQQVDTQKIQTHRNTWAINQADGKEVLLTAKQKLANGEDATLKLYPAENGNLEGFLTKNNQAYPIQAIRQQTDDNKVSYKLVGYLGDTQKQLGHGNAVNSRTDGKEVNYDQMLFRIGNTIMQAKLEGKPDSTIHESLGFKQPQKIQHENSQKRENDSLKVKDYKSKETVEKKPVNDSLENQSTKSAPRPKAVRP
ncbi:zeta toxin family protein [Zooshikella marina]|uniref:zeta toxin family protein n=1 Tax=Zooshikella ganghwensis TaxID=202772 RepID=UPI001BAF9514|nr:zeta toxin family protein [Zooshikella ganghwensis]MBU2708710.1 zeta toxin family protein [Zooshikella ganghwensis]